MTKLYSNPASAWVDGGHTAGFTYTPKGGTPFCVRMGHATWIPVNVMVFSDTPQNAIALVGDALRFMAETYHRDEEPPNPQRKAYQNKIASFLEEATVAVEEIMPNQLFKIGWADNDTVGI